MSFRAQAFGIRSKKPQPLNPTPREEASEKESEAFVRARLSRCIGRRTNTRSMGCCLPLGFRGKV